MLFVVVVVVVAVFIILSSPPLTRDGGEGVTYFGGGIRVGGGAPLALAFVVAVDDFSVVLFHADIAFPPLDIARSLSLSLFHARSLPFSRCLSPSPSSNAERHLSFFYFFLSLSLEKERMQRTLFFFFDEILFRLHRALLKSRIQLTN